MRPDEYDGHDGTALAALVRAGEVTAGELLDAALARHQATDAAIGAVVHVQDGVARSAIAAGLPDGPFTGVPFLVQDLGCEAIDLPTSMGSRVFDGYCYTYDSEIYVRLRAAGLVTFARTTTPEFGVGVTTESVVYGRPTRNPWDLGHVAGGSSGGAGAAVAAGVVPMAHGSDGGGSVRIPASSCGLFGVKPTRALLPDGPVAGEGWAGMAIDGYLTRSVRDAAALLDATAGPDLGAPYYAPPREGTFVGALARPPRRLRVAFTDRSFTGDPIDADCAAAVRHAAARLEALGHEVTEAAPTVDMHRFIRAWSDIVAAGTLLGIRERVGDAATADVERVTRLACEHGATVSGADYLAAVGVVHAIGRVLARFLQPYDVLLSATLAEPPAELGRFASGRADGWQTFLEYRLEHILPYSPFCPLANGTGQPAVSVPLWWTAGGLPVGVHLQGRAGEDDVLLQVAAQLEETDPWFGRRPPL